MATDCDTRTWIIGTPPPFDKLDMGFSKRFVYKSAMTRWRIYLFLDDMFYIVDCMSVLTLPVDRPRLGPFSTLEIAKATYFLLGKQIFQRNLTGASPVYQ